MSDTIDAVGGFTGCNEGTIKDSYCYISAFSRKFRCNFTQFNKGKITTSFVNSKGSFLQLWDNHRKELSHTIRDEKDANTLGFNTKTIWKITNDRYIMRFEDDKWYEHVSADPKRKTVKIKDVSDLEVLREEIDKGNKDYINAYVTVEEDIDCGGKKLEPIGVTRTNSFCGIFDGKGHIIKNLGIKGRTTGNFGFFGYLRGSVFNLTLDIAVKGEGNVGSLCAVNEGKIVCCGAVADVGGEGDRLMLGGLVGVNRGTIEKSYVVVKIKAAVIPLIPIALLTALFIFIGTVGFIAIPKAKLAEQIFAPIESDEEQIRIIDDEEDEYQESKDHSISFKFNQTVHIDRNTGEVFLNLENPSFSASKLVISLEVGDKKKGEERTVIAQSGAVEPGYGLPSIKLNDAGYDVINSGVREGTVVLTPYSKDNDEKSSIGLELPVQIEIEDK